MAAPTVRGVGTVAIQTGVATPGYPTGTTAGDLAIMVVECAGTQSVTVSEWTEVASSPQTTGDIATGTSLQVFYRTVSDPSTDNRTTSDSGNHQLTRIIGITAGTWNTSNPINATGGGVDSSATTSVSISGVTTTVDECLLVYAVSGSDPDLTTTTEFSSWANASLESADEQIDNSGTSGNGGAIGAATGVKATSGASGTMTVTAATSAVRGKICVAIEPAAAVTATGAGWWGAGGLGGVW